jgi:secreted trypsin-like serine protease
LSLLLLGVAGFVCCGLIENSGRIVGGRDAALGQFPYQASLRRKDTGVHFCGAFIVI